MQIGAMNHPGESLRDELAWMAEMKLDFIDLTLEPPCAATWQLKPRDVAAQLQDLGLGVVGHTSYYLPIASSFNSLRRAAMEELKQAAEFFAEIGARWMNVHPDGHAPFVDLATVVQRNIAALQELGAFGRSLELGIMLENVPARFNSAAQLAPVLEAVPEIGLHLDLGHCNLSTATNTAPELIARYGARLAHVHVHDNRGGSADLHLALGMGDLDLKTQLRELRKTGYDGTMTLEVFSPDRHFLAYSRDRLMELWVEAAATAPVLAGKSISGTKQIC
jgi:sugar phosphate isomerase/epimerase